MVVEVTSADSRPRARGQVELAMNAAAAVDPTRSQVHLADEIGQPPVANARSIVCSGSVSPLARDRVASVGQHGDRRSASTSSAFSAHVNPGSRSRSGPTSPHAALLSRAACRFHSVHSTESGEDQSAPRPLAYRRREACSVISALPTKARPTPPASGNPTVAAVTLRMPATIDGAVAAAI